MPRAELPVQAPFAFWRPGLRSRAAGLREEPEAVGIAFEGRTFVWHPPQERELPGFGLVQCAPVVTVQYDDNEASEVAAALQRFFSAVAFHFDKPVADGEYGDFLPGTGEPDPFHDPSSLIPDVSTAIWVYEAPAAVRVKPDPKLHVSLAFYREALNSSSPFYGFLAFWNVLNAVFDVAREGTFEAECRDAFISRAASGCASVIGTGLAIASDISLYFREDARNAIAHVNRGGRREINPDHPDERRRLYRDASCLRVIAREAIRERWPDGVRIEEHDEELGTVLEPRDGGGWRRRGAYLLAKLPVAGRFFRLGG